MKTSDTGMFKLLILFGLLSQIYADYMLRRSTLHLSEYDHMFSSEVDKFALLNFDGNAETVAHYTFNDDPANLEVDGVSEFVNHRHAAKGYISWNTSPQFVTRQGEMGVKCKYSKHFGVVNHDNMDHKREYTLEYEHSFGIKSYGIRFSLDANPSKGGGGKYKKHGMFLAGFHEGPKFGISVQGCIYVSLQSEGNLGDKQWFGARTNECQLVTEDEQWHELVVQVEKAEGDVSIYVFLDGSFKPLEPLDEGNGPFDNYINLDDLSAYHVCSDPKYKNTLKGAISKFIIQEGPMFQQPPWRSFDIKLVERSKTATYMDLNQNTWEASGSHIFSFDFFENGCNRCDILSWAEDGLGEGPAFQQIAFEEGVKCKYDDHWGYQDLEDEDSKYYTVDNSFKTNIISYAVRFSLNADPSQGGGGTYENHGYFLAGFYEGGKVGITPKGCVYFSFQSLTTWAGGVSRECNLLSKDGLLHEVVVTLDNNDPSDVKVFIWLDGVPLPLEKSGPHNNGVRTTGLSWFHICSDPIDKNALDGVITKVLVYGDYLVQLGGFREDENTLAYWKFNRDHLSSVYARTFINRVLVPNVDPNYNIKWSPTNYGIPFQNVRGEVAINCRGSPLFNSYGVLELNSEDAKKFTIDSAGIISYGIRFKLDDYPGTGGLGPYFKEGFFLVGFYEGLKFGITSDRDDVSEPHDEGCIYVTLQSKYPGEWFGGRTNECKLVSPLHHDMHEVVVTVDARNSKDVRIFVWVDGVSKAITTFGPMNQGVRTTKLSNFNICQDPKDKNTLTGAVSEVIIQQGFLLPEPCYYECPANSANSKSPSCARTFKDCSCNDGFKPSEEACEACDYECPENSYNKKQPKCAEKFKHCRCNIGYKANKKTSQCEECYQCPVNSTPKKDCPIGFKHCNCVDGSFRNEKSEECEID